MPNIFEKVISAHIEAIRPPAEIREELDIGFTFEKNTLIVFEKRPYFMDRSRIIDTPVIKASYIKSKQIWKIYRMRGNLKWYPYEPFPVADNIEAVFEILKEDKYGCFFG